MLTKRAGKVLCDAEREAHQDLVAAMNDWVLTDPLRADIAAHLRHPDHEGNTT